MLALGFVCCVMLFVYWMYPIQKQKTAVDVSSHYAQSVRVNKETPLYEKTDGEYKETGRIFKGTVLQLDQRSAQNMKENYFRLQTDDCYILADHVVPEQTEENSVKKASVYLPFNENIVTKDRYILEDEAGNKLAEVSRKAAYSIYVKDEKRYGVQIGDTLVYIPKSAVAGTQHADNTSEPIAEQIPVFMYHYFYSRENGEVSKNGNWLEVNDFEAQLKYLKEHKYVTLRMQDVENFLDGRVQLPRNSVSITIDDGTASIYKYAYPLLKEYGYSATLFLIGDHLKDDKLPKSFQEMKQNGMELQSHSYGMHTGGCEGGHGGALRCVGHDEGVADTEKSFSILGGGNVYCYPYGDVTESALQIMKAAGVHMAFTTNYGKIEPGMDKLQLPRVRIFGDADIQQFIYSLES